jgi:hypothetical protein
MSYYCYIALCVWLFKLSRNNILMYVKFTFQNCCIVDSIAAVLAVYIMCVKYVQLIFGNNFSSNCQSSHSLVFLRYQVK